MARCAKSIELRIGLAAGGRWIRTIGPPQNFLGCPVDPPAIGRHGHDRTSLSRECQVGVNLQDHDWSMLRKALLCASMLRLMATCCAICDMLALAVILRCSEASIRSEIRDSNILMESRTAHLPLLGAGLRAFLRIFGNALVSQPPAPGDRCWRWFTIYAPFEGSSTSPRRLAGGSLPRSGIHTLCPELRSKIRK